MKAKYALMATIGALVACGPSEPEVQKPPLAEITEWTAETISYYPQEYISHAVHEFTKVVDVLGGQKTRLKRLKARFEKRREAAIETVGAQRTGLDALRAAFTAAEAGNSWPITLGEEQRDRDWAMREIIRAHSELEGSEELIVALGAAAEEIDGRFVAMDAIQDDARIQVNELSGTSVDIIKKLYLGEDDKAKLVEINAKIEELQTQAEDDGEDPEVADPAPAEEVEFSEELFRVAVESSLSD